MQYPLSPHGRRQLHMLSQQDRKQKWFVHDSTPRVTGPRTGNRIDSFTTQLLGSSFICHVTGWRAVGTTVRSQTGSFIRIVVSFIYHVTAAQLRGCGLQAALGAGGVSFAAGSSGRLKTLRSGCSLATGCQWMMCKGSSKKVFTAQRQSKASLTFGEVSQLSMNLFTNSL